MRDPSVFLVKYSIKNQKYFQMKIKQLQELSNEELRKSLQFTKSLFKRIIFLNVCLLLAMFCGYLYQGNQRGFDAVNDLGKDFLYIAGFQFFTMFLLFLFSRQPNAIEKELNSRNEK